MADYIKATKLRPGQLVIVDNKLCRIHSVEHRTPGKGQALMQVKLRDLKTNTMFDKRFATDEKIQKADLDFVDMEFLYEDDNKYTFMNTETFEQIELPEEIIGDYKYYILPNTVVKILFFDGTPVGIELPQTVVLKVVDTQPFLKKATASAQTKPATLETGLTITVPGFINIGDLIKINTETGEYLSRANSYEG